jgi:hypothetical protein
MAEVDARAVSTWNIEERSAKDLFEDTSQALITPERHALDMTSTQCCWKTGTCASSPK